jgi:hypothetical protein
VAKRAGRVVVDPDFRVACGFFGHPKTKKLRRALGYAGVIALMKLWAWATTQRSDGDLAGLSDVDLEEAVDWPDMGEAGTLLPALVAVRFVDGEEGRRVLHDWLENNPYVATKHVRVERARKGAAARWGGQGELPLGGEPEPPESDPDASSMNSDAPSTTGDAPSIESDAGGNAPFLTLPYQINQSESLARAPEASPPSQSRAAALAAAMRKAGCPDADEFHPGIQAAIVEGLPAEAMTALLGTEKGRGKSAAYVVASVRGRMADAAHAGPGSPPAAAQSVSPSAPTRIDPLRSPEDHETAARKMREHLQGAGLEVATETIEQGATP